MHFASFGGDDLRCIQVGVWPDPSSEAPSCPEGRVLCKSLHFRLLKETTAQLSLLHKIVYKSQPKLKIKNLN